MNILVLGSGGREHALAYKISQSPKCDQLFIGPGNAGTPQVGTNVDLNPNDFNQIADFVNTNKIQMVVVGPEDPLVNGIKEALTEKVNNKNLIVVGPGKTGAALEGSKEVAKEFMSRHNIPTAQYKSFSSENLEEGYQFLETLSAPYVLKADGLAAGKGVLILNDLDEAKAELKHMLIDAKFGSASAKVVIEEFLDGIEFSVFALTDGKDFVVLPEAKDYKRIGEGDTGPNTGGMGAVSPVSFYDSSLEEKTINQVIKPTIDGIRKEGMDYKGFVFFGLINVKGSPKVIEYNVRMGDPETEVVIPRLKTDIVDLFVAMHEGTLGAQKVEIDDQFATTVMTVSQGYPGSYPKGKAISGLDEVRESIVFHAGTKMENEGPVTSGGRVMAFTSFGKTKDEALKKSYESIQKVSFDGKTFRKDIGQDLG